MCIPASFVLTKERVFWSLLSDSHEDIISEFGLNADGIGGPNIVRVEITPTNGRFDSPAEIWNYQIDQDVLPEWADRDSLETRARTALREWIAARVIREGAKQVAKGRFWAYGSATVKACGSATVKAYDSATVEAYDYATVEACDYATVKAYSSATVKACGSATVKAYDSATVEAYDYATVKAYGSATVEAYDYATVKAYSSATVKACGSATVKAYDYATVKAYSSATVKACENNATVRTYQSAQCVRPSGPYAVHVDCTGNKAICIVEDKP